MSCKFCAGCVAAKCGPGFFGDKCDIRCNPNCRALACSKCDCAVCNITSGLCVNGCDTGWFGTDCDQICPDNCHRRTELEAGPCDQVSGHCVEGCVEGYYGDLCNSTCSKQCVDSLCQQLSGECTKGCMQGFMGTSCQERTNDNGTDQIAGALGGAFVVILWGVVVVVLIFVIWRRRMKDYAIFNRNTTLGTNRGSSRRRLRRQSSASSASGVGGNMLHTHDGVTDIEVDYQEQEARDYLRYQDSYDTPCDMDSPIRCIRHGSIRFQPYGNNEEEVADGMPPGDGGKHRVQFSDGIETDPTQTDQSQSLEDISQHSDVWKMRRY